MELCSFLTVLVAIATANYEFCSSFVLERFRSGRANSCFLAYCLCSLNPYERSQLLILRIFRQIGFGPRSQYGSRDKQFKISLSFPAI